MLLRLRFFSDYLCAYKTLSVGRISRTKNFEVIMFLAKFELLALGTQKIPQQPYTEGWPRRAIRRAKARARRAEDTEQCLT